MVHKYVITSEKPIDISFIVTTGLDDIFFNGTNEKTSILTKEVKNNGTQEYTIKTRSAMLETATIMSQLEDVEVPLSMNGKHTSMARRLNQMFKLYPLPSIPRKDVRHNLVMIYRYDSKTT